MLVKSSIQNGICVLVTSWSEMLPSVGSVIREPHKFSFLGGGRGVWIAKSKWGKGDVQGKTKRKTVSHKETNVHPSPKEGRIMLHLFAMITYC